MVDLDNVASLRVARAVGAIEVETFVNEHGRTTGAMWSNSEISRGKA